MSFCPHRPAFVPASVFGVLLFILSLLMPMQAEAAPPPVAPPPAPTLPPTVRAELEHAHIPLEAVSIWVQPVDAPQPKLAFNADRPMNPASVMKIVTSFAVLEYFGPEKTWTTRIAGSAPIRKGTLAGNLYLIGDGDPVLTWERLWRLLRRLRGLGLVSIEGDIVLDHSALTLPPHDPNAFDGRGLRPYNSGGDGLLIHFNTQELALFPGVRAKDPVGLVTEPPLAGLVIDNQIVTSGRACDTWYRDLDARIDEKGRLVLTGNLPASCGPRVWATAPLLPPDFDVAMLRALWKELGGKLRGKVRNGTAPAETQPLVSDESAPLGEIVRTMNKWSSNIIARQLIAQLGRAELEAAGAPPAEPVDMAATGDAVALRTLAGAGIGVSGLVIDNGSGLSRNARVRADSLGTILVRAWQRPWMPEFIASLPIAGGDGTARKRLKDSPARGRAHLKTGTINDVKSIAGYVLDRNGRRHAVVMMVNHPESGNSRKAQDALIEWVWAEGAP